jgi:hypothetical protein
VTSKSHPPIFPNNYVKPVPSAVHHISKARSRGFFGVITQRMPNCARGFFCPISAGRMNFVSWGNWGLTPIFHDLCVESMLGNDYLAYRGAYNIGVNQKNYEI